MTGSLPPKANTLKWHFVGRWWSRSSRTFLAFSAQSWTEDGAGEGERERGREREREREGEQDDQLMRQGEQHATHLIDAGTLAGIHV